MDAWRAPLRPGPRIDVKTGMHHARRGRGRGRTGPTLRVTPPSWLYARVCQLGRSGIHALRQEQRGCGVGEGRARDGGGDACLVGFYSSINVHQGPNSPCVLGATYNHSLFVTSQDQ